MKKALSICLLGIMVITLSGCWDVQDITEWAYITAIGIDKGQENSDDYKITFEIVLPTNFEIQDETKKNRRIDTVEAASLGIAIEKLQTRVTRKLNLAHLRVVLIGEKAAKEKNFLDLANMFHRNPNIQMRIDLYGVQNAEARDILLLQPTAAKYMAKVLIEIAQVNFARYRPITFFDFLSNLYEHKGTAYITRALRSTDDQLVISSGAGVYNNWRLQGWLNAEEAKHANWLLDTNDFMVDAKEGKSLYTYMVDKKSTEIKPILDEGDLRYVVKVQTIGPLYQEQGKQIDATDPKVLKRLEELFEREIQRQVESAIAKAQHDFGVDYLGFDTALKIADHERLKELDWKEVFPNLPVTVEVDAQIKRFGLAK